MSTKETRASKLFLLTNIYRREKTFYTVYSDKFANLSLGTNYLHSLSAGPGGQRMNCFCIHLT